MKGKGKGRGRKGRGRVGRGNVGRKCDVDGNAGCGIRNGKGNRDWD
jgi:hypothetical protein